MSLKNLKRINNDFAEEKKVIGQSKRDIKEAERIMAFNIETLHIAKSNLPIYFGLVLLLITLIVLSFFTVRLFNNDEEFVTTTIVNNYHTNTNQVNQSFINIEAKEKMICLFEPNATEGKCYKKVGK